MVFDSQDKEYKALLDVVLDGPMVAESRYWRTRDLEYNRDDGIIEKAADALFLLSRKNRVLLIRDFGDL